MHLSFVNLCAIALKELEYFPEIKDAMKSAMATSYAY